MDPLMIVNVGAQTGLKELFRIKTESNIECELLMLNKVTQNKISCIEADWHQGPRAGREYKFGVKNYR